MHRTTGRGAILALLALIVGSSFFCRMTLNSLQQSLQAGMGLSDNQVALLLGSAMAVPAVIGGIPVGLLVDRFNRARLIMVFCLLSFAGTLVTALSDSLTLLFASRALIGFSTAAVSITVPSLLADLFPPSRRGRGSMIYGISQVGGMAVAFAVGGALVTILPATDLWRSGALIMSVPLLLVFLLSLLLREQPRMEIARERPSLAVSAIELWTFRRMILPLFGGVVAISVADGATLVWVVPTLTRTFGMSAAYANGVMGIALVVGGLLGPIFGGLAADRSLGSGGVVRAMSLLALLAGASVLLGLFAVAPGSALASVCLTAFLLVGSMVISVSLTLITVLLPNELRGFAVSVLAVVQILLSAGLSPSLVSIVAAGIGGPANVGTALAIVCAASSLVSAIAFLVGRRAEKRQPTQLRSIMAGAAFH
ncbi:MFS transporter [Sphingomonas sp. Root50]|nr:MFS transporter [Sphingomonas sp. Root1294]KQY65921.1 MFS transporter [Sphingomonas sp. Root50]KRB95512.1 MFS transporter [Sphingomonas sp. Root720]